MNKLEVEYKLKDNKLTEGWKRGSLYKVCKVQGGFAFKSEEFLKDGIPLIKISNINGESVKLEKNNSYVSNNRLKFYKSFIIKEGDILIALSGATVGKIGRIKSIKLSLLNQRVGRFIEYPDFISKKYLFYILLKGEMLKYVINNAASSAQPNISPSFIENFQILFPSSLTEQSKIAEILETVDEAIDKTDAIVEKYKRIKQGLMQDLLTRGIDGNGQIRTEKTHKFKDSPLGRIPEEWGTMELGVVGNIISGSTPSTNKAEFWNGSIVWITPDDLSKLENKYVYTSSRKISKKGLQRCSAKMIPKNSIVISSRAPIGYLAISKINMATNQGCKSIVLKNLFDVEFIYYCLHLYITKMIMLGSGTTFSEISKTELNKLKIAIPKFKEEQQRIALILSQIDDTIEKEQKYKEKLERIKQGLMEDLLTGKVRVNHLIKEGVESV